MNTATQVQIYNMALAAVGVSRFVQGLDEGSNEANTCNIFWAICRDEALQDFPWGFAMRYASLQTISKTVRNWLYCYDLPADCLQARCLIPDYTLKGLAGITGDVIAPGYQGVFADFDFWAYWWSEKKIPFAIVENEVGGGLAVATNEAGALLAYTARIQTIALWSPTFVKALSYLLASRIVAPLASNPKFAQTALQAYQMAISEAAALSMNEGAEKREPESEFITARY